MTSRYLKKKKLLNEKSVMKALEAQRGKYDKTFELWNAKQAELEEKRAEAAYERTQQRKLNRDATRAPNKTDLYDKF